MGVGALHFGYPDGRGVKEVWKSRWEGGIKNIAIHGGGGIFWNNPICALQNSLQQNVTSITENQQGS